MGFWTKLFQTLTGSEEVVHQLSTEQQETSAAYHRDPAQSEHESAIATLEAPPSQSDQLDDGEPPWWSPEGAVHTEPVELPRPELTTEARALESMLVSHFDGHDLSIPPLLNVAEQVISSLRDQDCDLGKVCRAISDDQVIAAGVIRMANSPLYRGLNKITSLRPAVNRLGIQALKTLMMRESLRSAMFGQKSKDHTFARIVWQRSLVSAVVMRELARFTFLAPDEAYLFGLLHDIGNVVVLRIADNQDAYMHMVVGVDAFEYLCWESHQEFGELIADSWKLPSDLTSLIKDHHTTPAADDPLRTARFSLQLIDMINALLGYAPYAPYDLLASRPVRALGLAQRPDFVEALQKLPECVEENLNFAG